MSFVAHIRACNFFRPERFLPLHHGAARIGLLRRDHAALLRRFPRYFAVEAEKVRFLPEGDSGELSKIMEEVTEGLLAEGALEKWRNECFTVAENWGGPPLFDLDRGALNFFGFRAYGVHVNGIRRDPEGLKLWIGRRAPDKKVEPNKLDNLVAGGIGSGHGIRETLVKEAEEEASLPPRLAQQARPVGAISYRLETGAGLRDDVLFLFDLDMPPEVTPRNGDGEIVEFQLLPAEEVTARVRDSFEFKFNVNLVIIDFALRQGLIEPEDPDYLEIVTGLHRPLD